MRLGLNLGYSGAALGNALPLVQEADRLGYHSVWSAEAYGSDAVTTITWVAAQTARIKVGTAIMQIPARTPTLTATTAQTLDQLSGGRFLLGLGVSGPQVVEGWHGVAFGKPLARTREYVEIVRAVWRRDKPLEFKGAYYQVPYAGPDATGLGKPLKSILHGRADIPIYLAAIGPRNVARGRARRRLAPGVLLATADVDLQGFSGRGLRRRRRGKVARALRRRPHRSRRRRGRRAGVPRHGQATSGPLRRGHGSAGPELLQ
jgi:alkanesulfonate monooxygenase SsuD/methylene tetrahydromethanopterin reductase-like flavin-dependent oxidoreductase (luciferase family)